MMVQERLVSSGVVGGSTRAREGGGVRVAGMRRRRGRGAAQQELRVGRVAAAALPGRRVGDGRRL